MLTVDTPLELEAGEIPDLDRLSGYLAGEVPQLAGPLEFFKFTAGNSNLAYLIRTPDREFVLKRQPPGAKAKSAHDMHREFRVLDALNGPYPLAPRPLLLCQDPAVLGSDFVVMERVRGIIVRGYAPEDGLSPDDVGTQFRGLIEAQAALHGLDAVAIGLGDLGRAEGYRARQIEGWAGRLEAARFPGMRASAPLVEWLRTNQPEAPQRASIVHNDFKMDNVVWAEGEPTRLIGVLDWEMATLGDPLMDLACTLSFWVERRDPAEFRALRAMPSTTAGAPTRREALQLYAGRTGADIGDFKFYLGYALLRRAAIEAQKHSRYLSGASNDERFRDLDAAVDILLEMCRLVITDQFPV